MKSMHKNKNQLLNVLLMAPAFGFASWEMPQTYIESYDYPPQTCVEAYNYMPVECTWEQSPRFQFFGGVDLLVFKPYQENLTYATKFSLSDFRSDYDQLEPYTVSNGSINAQEELMLFQYDPGFRVACGLRVLDSHWDVELSWTNYHSTASASQTAGMEYSSNGTFLQIPSTTQFLLSSAGNESILRTWTFVGQASGRWSLDFDQVDLLLSKAFYLTPSILLEPKAGLCAIKLKQKFHTDLLVSDGTTNGAINTTYANNQASRYEALGIKGGINSLWNVLEDFGIYSQCFTALYWGDYDVKQIATVVSYTHEPDVSLDADITEIDHDRYESVRLALDLALGFQYAASFNCDKNHIVARIGWESHWFYRQNVFTYFSTLGTVNNDEYITYGNSAKQGIIPGDLSLNGFVVSLGVTF